MRGSGAEASSGWPDDPKLEAAYNGWLDAATDAERRKPEADYQLTAIQSVPIIPCRTYIRRTPRGGRTRPVSEQTRGVLRFSNISARIPAWRLSEAISLHRILGAPSWAPRLGESRSVV
jgi:hypothetical protein